MKLAVLVATLSAALEDPPSSWRQRLGAALEDVVVVVAALGAALVASLSSSRPARLLKTCGCRRPGPWSTPAVAESSSSSSFVLRRPASTDVVVLVVSARAGACRGTGASRRPSRPCGERDFFRVAAELLVIIRVVRGAAAGFSFCGPSPGPSAAGAPRRRCGPCAPRGPPARSSPRRRPRSRRGQRERLASHRKPSPRARGPSPLTKPSAADLSAAPLLGFRGREAALLRSPVVVVSRTARFHVIAVAVVAVPRRLANRRTMYAGGALSLVALGLERLAGALRRQGGIGGPKTCVRARGTGSRLPKRPAPVTRLRSLALERACVPASGLSNCPLAGTVAVCPPSALRGRPPVPVLVPLPEQLLAANR